MSNVWSAHDAEPLTFGSLFAGIGGIDLGLERAGMRCVWQVEIDGYARSVLEKHWPDIRRWDDVRTFPPEPIDDWRCDVVAGGFPCQDISVAGKGIGLHGERSGLWSEFARIIRDIRPGFVLVENSATLSVRGLDSILGTLAALGYDAEWSVLSACALGAPHTRERMFILAYSNGKFWKERMGILQWESEKISKRDHRKMLENWMEAVANHDGSLDGVPDWMDRNRTIGNAVVPQIAEWIGRRIVQR